ncbi:MAG: MarR family winged helix-turn-helix transcriptional regulator [Castellaniella sp.]|uniref:MarR family winged helix-turn-helix transcriptional regulator n=1 Tax=Castellaniella sp. TaxID=1955812 RepID=UPI003A89B4BC
MQHPPPTVSPGADLLDRIVRLNRWVTRHTAWTVPLAQARVLSLIDEMKTARIGDLARAEHCTQPTMTTQVQRLQAMDLVSRIPDPHDARASLISLTAQGHQALAKIRRARAGIVESLLDQLDAADRAHLQDARRVLSALLEAAYRQTDPGVRQAPDYPPIP